MRLLICNKPGVLLGLAAGIGFLSLGLAYSLQVTLDVAPCPWCILARYGFFLASVWAFIGWRCKKFFWVMSLLASVTVVSTAASVGYLIWKATQTTALCGRDVLASTLNELPWVAYWPSMFEATGLCGTSYAPVMGFTYAELALVACGIMLALTGTSMVLQGSKKRSHAF